MRFAAVVVLLLSLVISSCLGWHRYSRKKMHKPHEEKDYRHVMRHYDVMMVAGCYYCDGDDRSEYVELFNLQTNTSCYTGYKGLYNTSGVNFNDIVGGYVNREALVCGGQSYEYEGGPDHGREECYKYDPHLQNWGPAQEMRRSRYRFAGIELHDHQAFWVTGGVYGGYYEYAENGKTTTEIYHDGYWSRGPDLHYPIERHCMVNINENETALVGGEADTEEEGDIIIWNWNTWTWRNGPRVPGDHDYLDAECGLLHKDGTNPVVVITPSTWTNRRSGAVGRSPTIFWDTVTDTISNVTNSGNEVAEFFEDYNIRHMLNLDHEKIFVVTNDTKAWILGIDGVEEIGETLQDRYNFAMFLVPHNYAKCNTADS